MRRELNTIAHIFEVAKEEWGFDNLTNPFRLKIKGSTYRRTRRLKDGELARLENACEQCRGLNYFYIPLAMYLAIETGMRLQEIFNLTWEDFDFDERRIEIRKSKTDHKREYAGRTIVLPYIAQFYLMRIALSVLKERRFKLENRVFPMKSGAFKQAWADVVKKRARIVDLTFHDLRHEAASRMDAMGLTGSERDLMMGHANNTTGGLYVHAVLKSIQDKFDRDLLGRPLNELVQRGGKIAIKDAIAQAARDGKIPIDRANYYIANSLLDLEGTALLRAKDRASYFRTHLGRHLLKNSDVVNSSRS